MNIFLSIHHIYQEINSKKEKKREWHNEPKILYQTPSHK